jgi:hypothetical protein
MGVRVPPSAPAILSIHFLRLEFTTQQLQDTYFFTENVICDIFVTFCFEGVGEKLW